MAMDKTLGYDPEVGCFAEDECIWCLINTARDNVRKYEGTPHETYWRSRYDMLEEIAGVKRPL